MQSSFEILQKKGLSSHCMALCPTMDLIATVSEEGTLNIFRIYTWEKILVKSASEITTSTSCAATLTFSPSGKLLALGHKNGEVSIVHIESGEVKQAYNSILPKSSPSSDSSIVHIHWCTSNWSETLGGSGYEDIQYSAKLAQLDTISMIESMKADATTDAGESTAVSEADLPYFISSKNTVLFVIDSNGYLTAYIYGVFPIFQMQTNKNIIIKQIDTSRENNTSMNVAPIIHCSSSSGDSYYCRLGVNAVLHRDNAQGSLNMVRIEQILHNLLQKPTTAASVLKVLPSKIHDRVASILLNLKADTATMQGLILTCGRKWKDACKVILLKLSLLTGTLDSYQIKMSPIHFLYTTCQAGLWHPGAVLSFSQHWNEQGLNRLRSAIDSASKSIVKILQMQVDAIATNVLLRCKELREVLKLLLISYSSGDSDENHDDIIISNTVLDNLEKNAELVLFKLDEVILVAREARDAFLLYIQYIREYGARAAGDDDALDEDAKKPCWNAEIGSQYLKLLDPRKLRPTYLGKNAQAEYITGTHLYAYLQDMELNPELVEILELKCGYDKEYLRGGVSSDISSTNRHEGVSALLQNIGIEAWTSHGSETISNNESFMKTFMKRSLVQQIKCLKHEVDDAMHQPCLHLSDYIQKHILSENSIQEKIEDGLSSQFSTGLVAFDITAVPITRIQDPTSCPCNNDNDSDDEDEVPTVDLKNCVFTAIIKSDRKLHITCASPRMMNKTGGIEQEQNVLYAVINSIESSSDSISISKVQNLQWIVGANTRENHTHSVSLVCAGQMPSNTSSSVSTHVKDIDTNITKNTSSFLFKIDMTDVRFNDVSKSGDDALLDDSHSVGCDNNKVSATMRVLPLRDIKVITVSGERGTAALSDSVGKVVVLNLELDE